MNRIKTIKAYCYKCATETNQVIEYVNSNYDTNAVYAAEKETEVGWVVEKTDYVFSACKGCDSYNLGITTYHIGPDQIKREVNKKHLPGKSKKQVESWIFRLNTQYIELLSEVYAAFNNSSYRLAMMGLRTIVDIFIVENIGDKGSFKQKLQLPKTEGYVSNTTYGASSIPSGNGDPFFNTNVIFQ
ncbi:MAG: hypothetical protein R3F41_04960 [Gammaproteobacteria bacterium]|nr:hypothetical protein [Pseudomonadales bacterium]